MSYRLNLCTAYDLLKSCRWRHTMVCRSTLSSWRCTVCHDTTASVHHGHWSMNGGKPTHVQTKRSYFGLARNAWWVAATGNAAIGMTTVTVTDHARVIISSDPSLERHVSHVCSKSFFHLRQLRRIRSSLDSDSASILVHAFVTTRVDDCNAILARAAKATILADFSGYWTLLLDVGLGFSNTHKFDPVLDHLHDAHRFTLVGSAKSCTLVADVASRRQLLRSAIGLVRMYF